MEPYQNIHSNFSDRKVQDLNGRYITNSHILPILNRLPNGFSYEIAGHSERDQPIFAVKAGNGPSKILIWSQMHGNESTSTKALFDFIFNIEYLGISSFLEHCSFFIIPILNPDGAQDYNRYNANGIDLNRDAQALTQSESLVLREAFNVFEPDFCFNMHDQRSIYCVGGTKNSASLSFLAPAEDKEHSISSNREQAMGVISKINNVLQLFIPDQISRFDDSFNINCVGDQFQSLGVPTILFEAGHSGDYHREDTRKYMLIALLSAIKCISQKKIPKNAVETYLNIPGNKPLFFDVLIKNVSVEVDGKTAITDIGILYEEVLTENQIHFVPKISVIDCLKDYGAHRFIDGEFEALALSNNKKIELGATISHFLINSGQFALFINLSLIHI